MLSGVETADGGFVMLTGASVPCAEQRHLFLLQNQLDALISQIYFRNGTLHVSDSPPLNCQPSTAHTAIHTGFADCSKQNLYDIYLLLCVQCWAPDDGQRNCPKHVEFHSKNKFEKLVHIVGFVIGMCHDARSSECQIQRHLVQQQ